MNARVIGDPVPPRRINPQLPATVEELVLHAMEREPNRRYPSAAAMKLELEEPQWVEVTGRAERVQLPSEASSRWREQCVDLSVGAGLPGAIGEDRGH